jgi:hypothetical protein
MRSSQNAGNANFRLCEVALVGHYPQSARHGSTGREFFHFGVHVSVKHLWRLNVRVLKLLNDLLVRSAMSSTNHELQVTEISLVQILLHAHISRWRGLRSWKTRNPRRPSFLLDSRQF